MTVTQKSKLKHSVSVATDRSRNELTQAQANLLSFINPTDAKCLARAAKKAVTLATHYSDVELSKEDLDDFIWLHDLIYHCKSIRKEAKNG